MYAGERVTEIGDLFPGAEVEKIGRSTNVRYGKVHSVMIQEWGGDDSTYEVAIMGTGRSFADVGDSGGCVFLNDNGTIKAAGILIGKNRLNDFALATPLRLILDMAGGYEWHE